MSRKTLIIESLRRTTVIGGEENLLFQPGVNLLIGPTRTGKTDWLRMLDYLMGDSDSAKKAMGITLSEKYTSISAAINISGSRYQIMRRWRDKGMAGKVIINEQPLLAEKFQGWIMDQLEIPQIHVPKGDPRLGHKPPILSWRELYRHIYRQSRFWKDLADQQFPYIQHAVLLLFLGIAHHLFHDDLNELHRKVSWLEVENALIEARESFMREQARQTWPEGIAFDISITGWQTALRAVEKESAALNDHRQALQRGVLGEDKNRQRIVQAADTRGQWLHEQQELLERKASVEAQKLEMMAYRDTLLQEKSKLGRAAAGCALLSPIRIQVCPACDQELPRQPPSQHNCNLCHRNLPDRQSSKVEEGRRMQFEQGRLSGEVKEVDEILKHLEKELNANESSLEDLKFKLVHIEVILNTNQTALSPIQGDLDAISQRRGILDQQKKTLLFLEQGISELESIRKKIIVVEQTEIPKLKSLIKSHKEGLNLTQANRQMNDSMATYFKAIDTRNKKAWGLPLPKTSITQSEVGFKIERKSWNTDLSGNQTLHFLLAYHFALMSLTMTEGAHYPGLSIIDNQAVLDLGLDEGRINHLIQPFISLLNKQAYAGKTQMIVTGRSFDGLEKGVNRIELTHVWPI